MGKIAAEDLKHQTKADQPNVDMHGAAILDENGNEIPITEEMIQNACECLAEQEHLCDKSKGNSD